MERDLVSEVQSQREAPEHGWVQGPGSQKRKKLRSEKSCIERLLEVFLDSEGLVHKEFLTESTTLNLAMYVEILKCLLQQIERARHQYAKLETSTLVHDNPSDIWVAGAAVPDKQRRCTPETCTLLFRLVELGLLLFPQVEISPEKTGDFQTFRPSNVLLHPKRRLSLKITIP